MKIETYHCPVCHSSEVALLPLNSDEKYEYSLEPRKGLQISFTVLEKELPQNLGTMPR